MGYVNLVDERSGIRMEVYEWMVWFLDQKTLGKLLRQSRPHRLPCLVAGDAVNKHNLKSFENQHQLGSPRPTAAEILPP